MTKVGFTIACIFFALILIIFCAHFAARLAQLKGRSRLWGLLGLLFNIVGLIIVSFLPSKRKDSINTNPVKSLISTIPALSRKTIYIAIGIVCAVIITVIAYDNIPTMIENHKYSQQVTNSTQSEYKQSTTLSGELENIFTGSEVSFAVTKNSDVYCIGKQFAPQLEGQADGIIYSGAKKVFENNHACYILDNSGKLFILEKIEKEITEETEQEEPTLPEFKLITDNVIDFSVSETTLGLIKSDNKLYMSGNNAYGQLGTGNKEVTKGLVAVFDNVEKVDCESTFTVALTKNGDAIAFGSNAYGQFGKEEPEFLKPIVIANNIKQVEAGDDFILLLNKNSEVSACGNNDRGQLGNGTTDSNVVFSVILKDIKEIQAAQKSAFALSQNNELYAFGLNFSGQLGLGLNSSILTPTVTEKDVEKFSTSGQHTLIIKSNGKVYATGYNNYGQLGKANSGGKFDTFVIVK